MKFKVIPNDKADKEAAKVAEKILNWHDKNIVKRFNKYRKKRDKGEYR